MSRIRKIISLIIFVPLGIALIVLCVANREPVRLALNPFDPSDSVLAVSGPLFLILFLALILGMVIGAVATWFAQSKYRRQARSEARAAIVRDKQVSSTAASSSSKSLAPAAKA